MSRVNKPNNRFLNMPRHAPSEYAPSKTVRIHTEHEDHTKAKTLSDWLFLKYDISYKTFRNKSKKRREELRAEFTADTGISLEERYRPDFDPWDVEGYGNE